MSGHPKWEFQWAISVMVTTVGHQYHDRVCPQLRLNHLQFESLNSDTVVDIWSVHVSLSATIFSPQNTLCLLLDPSYILYYTPRYHNNFCNVMHDLHIIIVVA